MLSIFANDSRVFLLHASSSLPKCAVKPRRSLHFYIPMRLNDKCCDTLPLRLADGANASGT